VNVFLLGLRGYSSPWWITYQQALQRGGHVRKGEKGSTVVFWKWNAREVKDADGEKHTEHSPILRYYTVFNVAQCDDIAAPVASLPPVNSIATADGLCANIAERSKAGAGRSCCISPVYRYRVHARYAVVHVCRIVLFDIVP